MSPDEKDNILKDEVERRLDDLFGEDDSREYAGKPAEDFNDEELAEYQDTLEFSEVEQYEDTQEIEPETEAGGQDVSPTKIEESDESPNEVAALQEEEPLPPDTIDEEESSIPDEIQDEGSFTPEEIYEEESFSPDEVSEETEFDKPPRFKELEAIILSIDWEINDETMSSLKDQVELLKEDYKNDKVVVMFLRLLGSVGKYIKNNKANAHPGSIKLLNSVYQNLEKVVLDGGLAENMREKLLLREVETFKKLKDEIALRKAEIKKKQAALHEEKEKFEKEFQPEDRDESVVESKDEEAGPVTGHLTPHEAFLFAMEEIKSMIQAEFKALRAELKLWRESR